MSQQQQQQQQQPKRMRIKAIRYNFTSEMMEKIQEFTRIHQFDERKKYKEEWNCWISTQEIHLKVSNEILRLRGEGCKWEEEYIKDKMYKTSKFYYKRKMAQSNTANTNTNTNTNTASAKEKEKYKGFTKAFLRKIDEYIMDKIKEKSKASSTTEVDVVPIKLYNEYCMNHQDDIKKEILRLREFHRKINGEVFSEKLKKTFSHRFYNVKQGINKV